jgi:tetratricopeptide (TPR) repeat protein
MSRQELAEAVNAYLWTILHRRTSLDASYVGKLENGKHRWPNKEYRQGFRAVLKVETDAELGFYPTRRQRVSTTQSSEGRGVVGSGGAEDGSRMLVVSQDEAAEMLAHLQQQWHILVRADNLFGPRHALTGVEAQLAVLQELMNADVDQFRVPTVRLAAQYAESAAWLHEDADDLERARYWTSQAMEWAYAAGDHTMVSWTAYRRSQQLTANGRATQAIGLAQAARRDEDQLPGPTRAAIRVQEAIGFAMRRNEDTAQRLLDEAQGLAADDSNGDARGGHGSFCTSAYIEAHRAQYLVLLRSPQRAIRHYEQALPAIAPVYRRDRAAVLAGKATAHAAANQPEEAAATARMALPMARRAGSQRIVRRLAAIGATLYPHRNLEAVAGLLHELDEVAS